MLAVLMLTSKGIAGVPRASLVVIAATLPQFNIPEAGMLLLLGIDHFLDMGRSATNVIGNSIATAVVSKWEGELGRQKRSCRKKQWKKLPPEDAGRRVTAKKNEKGFLSGRRVRIPGWISSSQ